MSNKVGDKLSLPARITNPLVSNIDDNFVEIFATLKGGIPYTHYITKGDSFHTFQESCTDKDFNIWTYGSNTAVMTSVGNTQVVVGTLSNFISTTPNTFLNSQRRIVLTSAGGPGSLASIRPAAGAECWGGATINGQSAGGYYFYARFAVTTLAAGMRSFIGVTQNAATAPTNIDPLTNTVNGKIGMAINSNTGNWNFIHNISGTVPTVINLGASFPVTAAGYYEFIMYTPPASATTNYYVKNMETGLSTTSFINTNKPTPATLLGRQFWATNNATASAVVISFNKITLTV
jgi:hypothetical protein